jgi:hypothetical protein
MLFPLFAGIAALLISGNGIFAQQQDRAAFEKGFEQLTQNAKDGLAKPIVKDAFSKDGVSLDKFAIASASVPITTTTTTGTTTAPTDCNLGIKVWFQLEDGTNFNPIKRKMGVKEKFRIHIQAAVPIYVALFQNYPDDRPVSRQVYPAAKYPDSFKAVQPGQSTQLPVIFEMDDDTRDEIMSMVVVRADAPNIQSTLTAQATTTTTTNNGTTTVTAQATAATSGTLKSVNDEIIEKKNSDEKSTASDVKFIISAPSATTSAVPNDTAFYMLGAGYTGQWQLTLKK